MFFLALILGMAFAFVFSFFIVVLSVCASNKMGDTTGTFYTFSKYPMSYTVRNDNYKGKSIYSYGKKVC